MATMEKGKHKRAQPFEHVMFQCKPNAISPDKFRDTQEAVKGKRMGVMHVSV